MSVAFEVNSFKAVKAGALVGFVDVRLPSGLVLHRCSVFSKDDKAWVSPPAKPILRRDGTIQKDSSGKARYEPTVSFTDRATRERWSAAVVDAIRGAYPDALVSA